MFKSIVFENIGRILDILGHKRAIGFVVLACVTFWYAVFAIDVAYKDKTIAEIGVDSYLENWRLHANTTDIFEARDNKKTLQDECDYLRRQIVELTILSAQLRVIEGADISLERERIANIKGDAEKKLVDAIAGLTAASQLYEQLMAAR